MKTHLAVAVGLFVGCGLAQAQQQGPLKTPQDKVSYSIGLDLGRKLQHQGIALEPDAFALGVRHAMGQGKQLLTDEQMREVLTAYQKELRVRHEQEQQTQADKNRKEGEAFLARNKSAPGVKTTASGLQYKVMRDGTGKMPGPAHTVTAHYRGTLIDGTEFDSSYKRGEPASFPVTRVISGWTEALQMMKTGAKWMVYIPSNLGYGERGAGGGLIGPNATLIFEIELIDFK